MIVRLRLKRIPEENQQVDLAIGDPGADLLVAAEGPAAETGDGQVEFFVKQPPGGTGGIQAVPGQDRAVESGPFGEVLFSAVVRDERDSPPSRPCGLIADHSSSVDDGCCRDGTGVLSRCV